MKKIHIKGAGYIGLLLSLLFSVPIVFMVEIANRSSVSEGFYFLLNNPRHAFINLFICFAINMFLYSIFSRAAISSLITLFTLGAMGFVNMSKMRYQGQPFLPWDVYFVQDALRVMPAMQGNLIDSHTTIFLGFGFSIMILLILYYIFFERKIYIKRFSKAKILSKIIIIGFAMSILAGFSFESSHRANFFRENEIVNYFWNQGENYQANGLLLGFTINLSNIIISKPINYNEQKMSKINDMLLEFEKDNGERPDIIVIMSEGLSDFTKVEGLQFSQDPMPKFREIGAKGMIGEVYVPVLGGKTANAEFEFLTGYNIKHLPEGSVPYQQHIKNDIFSLARLLNEEGYSSTAIHNNIGEFWNRNKVYDFMGFDRFIDIEEFEDPFFFGSWMSDKDMMDKIIEVLEEENEDSQFIFAVTVQNHAPYYIPAGLDEIYVEGELSDEDREMLQRYLTGVKVSDDDLYYLYEYLKDREKPAIICVFGDHLPGGFEMYRTHPYYVNMKAGTSRKDLFATPYLIWANYKEEPKVMDLGANALPGALLDYADTKVDGFFGYIFNQYIDNDPEQVYFNMSPTQDYLIDFRETEFSILYDDLFGKKYRFQ